MTDLKDQINERIDQAMAKNQSEIEKLTQMML